MTWFHPALLLLLLSFSSCPSQWQVSVLLVSRALCNKSFVSFPPFPESDIFPMKLTKKKKLIEISKVLYNPKELKSPVISFKETSISIFKIAVGLDHRVARARQRLVSPFLAATCGSPGHVTPKKFLSSGSSGVFHLTQILVSFQSLRLNIPIPRRYYSSFLDVPDS